MYLEINYNYLNTFKNSKLTFCHISDCFLIIVIKKQSKTINQKYFLYIILLVKFSKYFRVKTNTFSVKIKWLLAQSFKC